MDSVRIIVFKDLISQIRRHANRSAASKFFSISLCDSVPRLQILVHPGELAEAGIPEGLIRLAVGLEEGEEIVADLKQAFAQL